MHGLFLPMPLGSTSGKWGEEKFRFVLYWFWCPDDPTEIPVGTQLDDLDKSPRSSKMAFGQCICTMSWCRAVTHAMTSSLSLAGGVPNEIVDLFMTLTPVKSWDKSTASESEWRTLYFSQTVVVRDVRFVCCQFKQSFGEVVKITAVNSPVLPDLASL